MNASIAILFLALLQKSIAVYHSQDLSVNEVAPVHRYLKRDSAASSSGPPTQEEEENDFENGLIDENSEDFAPLSVAEKAFALNNPVCGLCSSECALYCNDRHFNTFFVECCFKETETFARYMDVVSPAKRRDPFMEKFERFDEPLVLPLRTAPVSSALRSFQSPAASIGSGGTDDMLRMGKRSFYRPSQIFHQKRVKDSLRLGKRALFDNTMRLGKRMPWIQLGTKRGLDESMRLGKRGLDESMRLGKRGFDDSMRLGKRAFDDSMRLGKRDMLEDQDLASFDGYSNVMLGKRAIGDNMRLGKRGFDDSMRLGKRGFDNSMRLGKRAFDDSMRLGKRGFDDSMRLGKRAFFDEERKRALVQSLRLGKRSFMDDDSSKLKRMDSLRLGKRGAMDTLRLGKRFWVSNAADQDFHSEDAADAEAAKVYSTNAAEAAHDLPQKRQQYAVDTLRLGKRSQEV